ncbi:hypothetical protein HER32_12045 [Hymenobacter sp. BT18]|uniref:hypothetical protein n=1 Tax=Hymenobacter sp. BT18 TaxID=2835648 RepID=UPI00143E90FC|nr:hypothetical protein [Hymenobacter sp. BT18]QIX61874.1 hypothetical protein HER32_12045 [Hymenobacter sp. BT18]
MAELTPKVYQFDEGTLQVSFTPRIEEGEPNGPLQARVLIKATGMPPGKYKVGDSWVEEVYAEEVYARHRFDTFSQEDAEYCMQHLYLNYLRSADDY